MKKIIIIFIIISTQLFADTIRVEIGEVDIINKLTKAGARDLWNFFDLYPPSSTLPKHTVWGLSGSNNIAVEVWAPEGRVTNIYFWNYPNPYVNDKSSRLKNRHDAQSFIYNIKNKTIQVVETAAKSEKSKSSPMTQEPSRAPEINPNTRERLESSPTTPGGGLSHSPLKTTDTTTKTD